VGIYVECNDMTKDVTSTAEEFGFEYHNKDLNGGLHNLANLMAMDLTFQEIPDRMDYSNDATTPVLILLLTVCPIGYGRLVPSGKLNKHKTKAALQACHDGVFA
jgi:hypothetical protein